MPQVKTYVPEHILNELKSFTGKDSGYGALKAAIQIAIEHEKHCARFKLPEDIIREARDLPMSKVKTKARSLSTDGGWHKRNIIQALALNISFKSFTLTEMIQQIVFAARMHANATGKSFNQVMTQDFDGDKNAVFEAIQHFERKKFGSANPVNKDRTKWAGGEISGERDNSVTGLLRKKQFDRLNGGD